MSKAAGIKRIEQTGQLGLEGIIEPGENRLDVVRRYNTPTVATKALIKHVHVDGMILECCVGEGFISTVLEQHLAAIQFDDRNIPERGVWTNDLDPTVKAIAHLDATKLESWAQMTPRRPDWVVSNPEFAIAHLVIPLAYEIALLGVAMLLRITWAEPTEKQQPRGQWLSKHPPQFIVLPRLSFKTVITTNKTTGKEQKSTTDSATCAWFVWYKFPIQAPNIIVTKEEMRQLC